MSPSTRSGRTYSEASSIASSRRSSTTGIAREKQAKSRKPARQQDSDHPPSKEVDPAKESRPDILEGCIADGVQEIHNKAVTTVRTGKTTDKTYLNPTIREGQEETNHISGDTDVKPIETPSAVHSRPADNDPTTGAQLPSGTSLQDQSIPTVGRDGRRPTGGSRPERRSGSFDGYRTNESVDSSDDSLDVFNQTLTTDKFRIECGRRPSLQDLPSTVPYVRDSEKSEPARGRHTSADRMPALVPQHIEEVNLAVRPIGQQWLEPVQRSKISQAPSETRRPLAADGQRISTLRELHLLQQPTREKTSRDGPQQARQDTETRHLVARDNGGGQSLTTGQSPDTGRVTQGGGSLQAPQEGLDLQLVHTTLASLHNTLIDEIHARFLNFDEKLNILHSSNDLISEY
ncbi:hypothetical protein PGTUg99_028609 [Puccinia graminis f. sp. tritici]|uniref:Uncharacterized protein n=1 Tax=Puccinia graminis f. sp. tritici TaxID=56615 RepID=A0A5B0QUN0_PUCGR|nr:hypothetical protein PGTUg99_028609 [Puccinia graminis f. sp. tritici]